MRPIRLKLAVVLPFVLGIFIGTLLTSFLILAVQSIDEEAPLQKSVPEERLAEPALEERESLDMLQEEVQVRTQTQTILPTKAVSYNVLTSRGTLKEQSFAIHRTWGGEKAIQGSIDYYVHPRAGKEEMDFATSRKIPVTSLEIEQGKELAVANRGIFKLWKNICTKKLRQYRWFVKARDDVYLRRGMLEKLLSSLNSSEALFVGDSITPRGIIREDLGLREGESYCHEGCYALSWRALEMLCPKLEACQEDARSTNEDVEVARCMRTYFGVNCTAAMETKELFYSANNLIEQEELQTGEHSYNDKVSNAITLTPLTKPDHFYNLHHYYTAILLNSVSVNNSRLRAHMIKTSERGAQSDSLLQSNEHQSPPWTKLGVNPPYKPTDTEDDVIRFESLDEHLVYTESKHYPSRPVSRNEQGGIDAVYKAVVKSQVDHGYMSNTSTMILEKTLKRTDPQRGTDYFLEIAVKDREGFVNTKFLHSLQEFLPVQVNSLSIADYKSTKVNFVVATPPVSRGFQKFIMSFENNFLARKPMELVGILVIMYSDGLFRTYDKDLFAVSTLINLYKNKYPEADLRIITTKNKFSRLDMLKIASKEYPSYELLFIADIHIDFSMQFLERCRMNTLENKQVYFPSVFNPYNPSEFYKEKILYPYATKFQINEQRGSWMQNSYHLACVYNYDLMKALDGAGRDLNEGDRRGDDTDEWSLVNHFVQQNQLRIFHSVEPGLVHLWQDGCKEVEGGSQEEKLCLQLDKNGLLNG